MLFTICDDPKTKRRNCNKFLIKYYKERKDLARKYESPFTSPLSFDGLSFDGLWVPLEILPYHTPPGKKAIDIEDKGPSFYDPANLFPANLFPSESDNKRSSEMFYGANCSIFGDELFGNESELGKASLFKGYLDAPYEGTPVFHGSLFAGSSLMSAFERTLSLGDGYGIDAFADPLFAGSSLISPHPRAAYASPSPADYLSSSEKLRIVSSVSVDECAPWFSSSPLATAIA